MVFAGCSPSPGPTPTAQSAVPSPSGARAVHYADRIRIGIISPGDHDGTMDVTPRRLSNATSWYYKEEVLIERFLYNGLFRYDETLRPVPDLATGPCDVSQDGLTATCSIRKATFANGTPGARSPAPAPTP